MQNDIAEMHIKYTKHKSIIILKYIHYNIHYH